MVADSFLSFVPGIRPDPEHSVIGETDASEGSRQYPFLFDSRIESESIGSFDLHSLHFN